MKTKHKCLVIFSDIDLAGYTGQPKVAMDYVKELRNANFPVTIFSNAQDMNKAVQYLEKDDICIEGNGSLLTYFRALGKLLSSITTRRYSVVITHGALLTIFIMPFLFFKRTKIYFSLCEVLGFQNLFYKLLYSLLSRRAKGVIVTSNLIKSELSQIKIHQEKIIVRMLGLDNKFCLNKKQNEFQYDIMYFGDAKIDRGFQYLEKLAIDFPNLTFLILIRWIEDQCQSQLEQLNGFDNVCVKYYPYTKDLKYFLDISKIVFLPFKFMGVRPPLSIIESMAAGKVVITSNMRGNEELITHGHNGFTFAMDSQYSDVTKAIDLILKDQNLASTIAKRARNSILEAQKNQKSLCASINIE
jgi:glycosyltransferase involved in cell wall biosynthesis